MNNKNHPLIFWTIVIVSFLLISKGFAPNKPVKEIQYSEFVQLVKEDKINEVQFGRNNLITGTIDGDKKLNFETSGPSGDNIVKLLEENKVKFEFEKIKPPSIFIQLLFSFLPMILIIGFLIFMMKKGGGGGGGALSFGKSNAKLAYPTLMNTRFTDVAGAEEAKSELEEIVDFLKSPKKFTELGGRIPKGVLMIGPPGTGKTLLAKAVAGEAGVPFLSISGSDFVEVFVGVGASRVRDLFTTAKKQAPCIIFIDEVDAVGKKRGSGGMSGANDEREQTLNQLLVEMDGFEGSEGIIVMAATNRVDTLDPAFLRPGRFDRRVNVSLPDAKGREAILRVHTRKTPLNHDVQLSVIAKGTPGFSGADLENLVNEAALHAAKNNNKVVKMEHFEYAKDKVTMGPERKSMVIPEKERKNTAYHEAGHAIVGKMLPEIDPIHKITIVPRGQALGLTQTLPNEDRLSYTRTKANSMIAFLMGGRAAEDLIFNERTTGASNDIERATNLAKRMVCEWGMSEKFGPVSIAPNDYGVRDISQKTADAVDAEVKHIVEMGYRTALDILKQKRKELHKISEKLLEKETIDGSEFNSMMEANHEDS